MNFVFGKTGGTTLSVIVPSLVTTVVPPAAFTCNKEPPFALVLHELTPDLRRR
jgi:hypothetical protein